MATKRARAIPLIPRSEGIDDGRTVNHGSGSDNDTTSGGGDATDSGSDNTTGRDSDGDAIGSVDGTGTPVARTDASDSGSGGNGASDSGRGLGGGSGREPDSGQRDHDSQRGVGDSGDATGNGGNGRGDGRDTGQPASFIEYGEPITGPGGRHKRKQCPCERCVTWRQSAGVPLQVVDDGGEDDGPAPVSFDALSSRVRGASKNANKEMLKLGLSVAYSLPQLALPPGTADHWPLSKIEEETLATRVLDVADMLPKRTRARVGSAAAKFLAPIALVVTAVVMTKPRIDMTRELIAQLKRGNARDNNSTTGPSGNGGTGQGSGTGNIVGSIPRGHATGRQSQDDAGSSDSVDAGGTGNVGGTPDLSRVNTALSDPSFG